MYFVLVYSTASNVGRGGGVVVLMIVVVVVDKLDVFGYFTIIRILLNLTPRSFHLYFHLNCSRCIKI